MLLMSGWPLLAALLLQLLSNTVRVRAQVGCCGRSRRTLQAAIDFHITDPEGCRDFTGLDINDWDVTGIEDFKNLFRNRADFNDDISGWDTSDVTNMKEMFSGAASFNINIDAWNIDNVEDMEAMFKDATSFDQALCSWQVVDKEIDEMFDGAGSNTGAAGSVACEEKLEENNEQAAEEIRQELLLILGVCGGGGFLLAIIIFCAVRGRGKAAPVQTLSKHCDPEGGPQQQQQQHAPPQGSFYQNKFKFIGRMSSSFTRFGRNSRETFRNAILSRNAPI